MISSPRSPIMKFLSGGRQLGMHSFQIQARFRSAQATPIRSTANGIVILTTVELTLGKGYGESHVGFMPRHEQESWQGAHRLRGELVSLYVS